MDPQLGQDEGTDQGSGSDQGGTSGIHPAWQEYLNDVPAEYHEKVIPAFKAWDQGVQQKIQSVHSTYEPWKQFVDSGIEPDQAKFGLEFVNTLQTEPAKVAQAIIDYYNLGDQFKAAEAAVEQGQEGIEPDPYDSRFSELERQNRLLAQALLHNQERDADMQAEAELDAELTGLYQKYGKFDQNTEQIILSLMANGHSGEDAANLYFGAIENSARARTPKPLIMGAGGGAPGNGGVDPKKLDESGTKNLVVQMLQAAAEQRRQ